MRPVFHPRVYADLAKILEYYEQAGWWISLKNAVILSGVPGGFATGTERRIADCKWAEAAGTGERVFPPTASAHYSQRFFTAFRPRLRPRRNSVQNDGVFL